MFNLNNDFILESYFVVLGMIGVGKSLFLNAISETNCCQVGCWDKPSSYRNQLVSFVFNGHRFYGIDTPGLDDYEDNEENINNLRNLFGTFPQIAKILIIKKYNDYRIPSSLQKALIAFMEVFQNRDFWKHFIIINTWANPYDECYRDYMEGGNKRFLDRILQCENLVDAMKKNNIQYKSFFLKEYFVCSKNINKYPEIKETFNMIKNEIKIDKPMFEKIQISEIKEKVIESPNRERYYIIQKYKTITCIDFDHKKTQFDEILGKKEVKLEECQLVEVKEESIFIDNDEVKWFDVLSLGIARATRNTKIYRIYKVYVYKVGDKLINDRIFVRKEYR